MEKATRILRRLPMSSSCLSSCLSRPASVVSRSALANDWANWLDTNGSNNHIAEVAGFAAHRRSHLEYRAAVCATTREELIAQLRKLGQSDIANTNPAASDLRIAFVCSGQGPQWWAMGRKLLTYCPAFREVVESCGREFARYSQWSLVEELMRSEATSRMQQTHIAQPSLFAIQVGLAAEWKSWGIEPTVVVGHSVGEIAAAYIAGHSPLAMRVCSCLSSRSNHGLASSRGAMLAVGLSVEEIDHDCVASKTRLPSQQSTASLDHTVWRRARHRTFI